VLAQFIFSLSLSFVAATRHKPGTVMLQCGFVLRREGTVDETTPMVSHNTLLMPVGDMLAVHVLAAGKEFARAKTFRPTLRRPASPAEYRRLHTHMAAESARLFDLAQHLLLCHAYASTGTPLVLDATVSSATEEQRARALALAEAVGMGVIVY